MITKTNLALKFLCENPLGKTKNLEQISPSILESIISNSELIEIENNNYKIKESLIELYSQNYFHESNYLSKNPFI